MSKRRRKERYDDDVEVSDASDKEVYSGSDGGSMKRDRKKRKEARKEHKGRDHHKKRSKRDDKRSSSKSRHRDRRSKRSRRGENGDDDGDSQSNSDATEEEESSGSYVSRSRHRRRRDDDSYSSSDRRRRHHKKEKKKKSSKSSKRSRRRTRHEKEDKEKEDKDDKDGDKQQQHEQQHELADALLNLLSKHPGMAEELPIILIRLCSGSTFSLQQSQVQEPLERVFQCLELYGLHRDFSGTFSWQSPLQEQQPAANPELTLVRVVRRQLQDIGLSAAAVVDHEQGNNRRKAAAADLASEGGDPTDTAPLKKPPPQQKQGPDLAEDSSKDIPVLVQRMIRSFPGVEKELIGLCETILQGESVSLEGLPNEQLKQALSSLLEVCRLEECEMEDDDEEEEEDGNDEGTPTAPSVGFCVPETNPETATACLKAVMDACQTSKEAKRVLGPMRPPPSYVPPTGEAVHGDDDDNDDEGPQLTSSRDNHAGPSDAQLKAQFKRRQRELERAKAGLDPSLPLGDEGDNGREEWMLVPGQYDFLDSIKTKSGQPARSRTFQNVKQAAGGGSAGGQDVAIDPKIQAEMDALVAAHQESRGQSLMEEHQALKQQQREEKQKQQQEKGTSSWQWNRNKDLDAGRRVDKDALQMVLGGASDGLKTKFQGGFQSG